MIGKSWFRGKASVRLSGEVNQEFPVPFWTQDWGWDMARYGPFQIFEEDAEALDDLAVKYWIADHPSLAHLPLFHFELGLD